MMPKICLQTASGSRYVKFHLKCPELRVASATLDSNNVQKKCVAQNLYSSVLECFLCNTRQEPKQSYFPSSVSKTTRNLPENFTTVSWLLFHFLVSPDKSELRIHIRFVHRNSNGLIKTKLRSTSFFRKSGLTEIEEKSELIFEEFYYKINITFYLSYSIYLINKTSKG